jgi:PAS domain S-box-containing protein
VVAFEMKLRSHLIVLVVAALLPLLIFAGVMIVLFDRQQRASVETRMIDTARALSLAVDREVTGWTGTLEGLGASKQLDSGHLRAFYEEAQRVLKAREGWNNILLADSEGRQLLNLRRPLGAPLPSVRDLEQFQQTIRTARPAFSNLYVGRVSHEHLLGVTVPVVRDGKARYVLASSASPNSLLQILVQQDVRPDWIGTIVDGKGIVVATTRGATELVGKPAMLPLGTSSGLPNEGSWRSVTQEGIQVQVASRRSELTGWSVRLAIPVSVLEAPLRRSLLATVAGGALLFIGAVVLAFLFGRRIAKPIAELSASAEALGRGELPKITSSPIIEVSEAAHEIQDAAVRRREVEAQLQKVNEELHRSLQSLRALYSVASSLNQSLQAEPVIHNAVQEITRIFQFEATRVFLYNRAKDEIHLFCSHEADPNLWTPLKVCRRGEGILGRVYETGESIVFENVQTDPCYHELSRSKAADAAGYSFLAVYPVKSKAETLGVMVFIGRSPRRLETYEEILIRSIVEQLGVAFENAELIGRLRRNVERFRALHEVSLAVNSNLDLNSILNVLFDQAGRVVPHAAAEIRLLNRETGVLEPTACRNLDIGDWRAIRAGRGLAKVVLDTNAPLAVRDVRRDPRTANPEFMQREGIVSFLGVPLTVMGDVIGCFIVLTREDHDFDNDERELFSALASQAAIAIHNAQLYEQVKKQAADLAKANRELQARTLQQSVVSALGSLALARSDVSSLLDEAVVLIAQTLRVEYAKVLELLPDGNALLLRAGVGWKDGLVGRAVVSAGTGSQAGYTLRTRASVIVEDLAAETRFSGPALLTEHGVVSGASVVIHGKEKPYGVLGAHATSRRAFSEDDINFLQSLANLLATAIERKQAEEALRKSEERFRLVAKATNDAVWEWNIVTNEVWWNEGVTTLFRYPPDEVAPGIDWSHQNVHPDDRNRILSGVHAALKSNQLTWRDEYRYRCGDGSYAFVVDRGYVIYENGRPTRMIGCMTDITQSKEARAELENSHERLRALAAHLQAAREEERTRVAREIHDELGQSMTGLKMDLSWLRKKLPKDQDALREKTDSMLGLMDQTIQSVRRISTDLRPGVLDDLGLAAAIEWQIHEFQKRTGIKCQLAARLEDIHLDRPRSTALFRIFQETLTNITRHAHASRVRIKLAQTNGNVTLEVQDNGNGIPKTKLADTRSLGILGMRERALLLGGEVIINGARGKGTTVTARMPVEADD